LNWLSYEFQLVMLSPWDLVEAFWTFADMLAVLVAGWKFAAFCSCYDYGPSSRVPAKPRDVLDGSRQKTSFPRESISASIHTLDCHRFHVGSTVVERFSDLSSEEGFDVTISTRQPQRNDCEAIGHLWDKIATKSDIFDTNHLLIFNLFPFLLIFIRLGFPNPSNRRLIRLSSQRLIKS